MKNTIALFIAVLLAGAAYYFFVIKKSTATSASATTPPVAKLTDTEVKGLTDAQIQSLSLDQIKALTVTQLGQLTPSQTISLAAFRTKLQTKADEDAAAATAAEKIKSDAAIETARIEALKKKMGVYTMAQIDSLTEAQLDAFTDEELDILGEISAALEDEARTRIKKYDEKNQFIIDSNHLSADDKADNIIRAKNIAGDLTWFVWEHAHIMRWYEQLNSSSDAKFYDFVTSAWSRQNTGESFSSRLSRQDFYNHHDNTRASKQYSKDDAQRFVKALILKAESFEKYTK